MLLIGGVGAAGGYYLSRNQTSGVRLAATAGGAVAAYAAVVAAIFSAWD
jgi:hypothetical protein